MEEIALCNAYVIANNDGSYTTYNCTITAEDGGLTVMPTEPTITRIHVNAKAALSVKAVFGTHVIEETVAGMQWVGPGGVPEDLCQLDLG